MNQRRRSMLGMALLGMAPPLLAARSGTPGARAQLDGELAAIAADPACTLASLSVLAIRAGTVAYEGGFGRRSLDTPGQMVDGETLFRIASVSKMMTTLGLMRLVEDGLVDLEADVSAYLGFRLRNPHFPRQAITLRQLLSHTASLRDAAGYSWPAGTALRDILVPGAALHGDGAMWAADAAPGAYFSYCNLGWGVIGTLMERVTGERFDLLMRRLLLAPLGLRGGYNPAALDPATLATLYRKRTVDTEVWDAAGPWIAQADAHALAPPGLERYEIGANATPFSPTGGLRIGARGLGAVMLMLMDGGLHEGRRFLREDTLARMFDRQWTFDGANGDTADGLFHCWGLGNQQFPDSLADRTRLVEGGGFAAVGHLGDAYGLMAVFALDRQRRNGMVALVGGTSSDPFSSANKGMYSALPRFQERILTALYRRAILVQTA